jgi:hypothetical protein
MPPFVTIGMEGIERAAKRYQNRAPVNFINSFSAIFLLSEKYRPVVNFTNIL